MARATFGGGVADFVFNTGAGNVVRVTDATLTFWDAEVGGNKHTDLLIDGDAVSEIHVPATGQVPTFEAPDGVYTMWADAGGDRVLIAATGDIVEAAQAAAEDAADSAAAAAGVGATNDAIMASRANDDSSAFRAALTRTGAKPVGRGEQAENVKDHGAVGNGVADDTTAIQAAATAAAAGVGIVYVPAGRYKITATLNVPSNVTLWGTGASSIIDMSAVAAVGAYRVGIQAKGTTGSALPLTVNATQGQLTVTMSSGNAATLAAGDLVVLGSTGDYYPYFGVGTDVDRGEIKEVHSIAGGVVTFKEALYDNYPTASTAFVRKITPVRNVAVENLRIESSTTATASSTLEKAIDFEYVNGFHVGNVDGKVKTATVHLNMAIRGEVTGCKTACPYWDGTGSHGIFSGIAVYNGCQWVRVHHNHGQEARHAALNSSSGAGQGWWGQPRFISFDHNIAKDMFNNGGSVWAFEHHGFGQDVVYDSNIIDGCRGGFNIEGGNVSILNNTIRHYSVHAIEVDGNAEFLQNVTVRGNRIGPRMIRVADGGFHASSRAIYMDLTNVLTLDNVVIDSNNIEQQVAAQSGIELAGSVAGTNIVIKGNAIRYTGTMGTTGAIKTATTSGVSILGNTIYNSALAIRALGGNAKIVGNIIDNPSTPASGAAIPITANNCTVVGNVLANTFRGIQISAAVTGTKVAGNVIGASSDALGLDDGGTGSVIEGNVVNNSPNQMVNLASATTTTLPTNGVTFNVTGTTTITSVTASRAGRVVFLKFAGILTFTDGSNLRLNGDFVTAANGVLQLVSDGTNWYEVSRSAN